MFKRRYLLRFAVVFLIPLSSVALLALPETSSQILSHGAHPFCWCGCDKMAGAKRCMKMCELPKYADRAWATTCHKSALTPERAPAAAPSAKPAFHTSRRYRYMQAQNQNNSSGKRTE